MCQTDTRTAVLEIKNRITSLQDRLAQAHVEGALILQKADLYYFSGTAQEAHLYVPAAGDPVLMVHKDVARARKESTLENIVTLSSPRNVTDLLRHNKTPLPKLLGMELDVLPANLYLFYKNLFAGTEIKDISRTIRQIRAVKSSFEIEMIQRAAQLTDRLMGSVPELIHEGMPQIELAGNIESTARSLGHQGIVKMRLWGAEMFYGHIMAGPSAAVPSYLSSPTGGPGVSAAIAQGPDFTPIMAGEPIIVDFMFTYNGYLSDHTRIFAISHIPDDLSAAHQAMLDIQEMIKKIATPGTRAGDLYDKALEKAAELGYADHFMGTGDQRIRFVGHGIGVEVDEFPFLAKGQTLKLQEKMVIALEPKVILPGRGVVGIENTHVVTKNGLAQMACFQDDITIV